MERLRLARDLGVSYKRLHGWEPQRIHRGYDRDGQRVALADAWEIVVETEPEWDDDQRAQARALVAYEAGICRCGFHSSITADRSNFFTFEDRRCSVCAQAEKYGRIQDSSDEAAVKAMGETPPPGIPRPTDGRQTFLRRMSPTEVAEARERRGPARGRIGASTPALR